MAWSKKYFVHFSGGGVMGLSSYGVMGLHSYGVFGLKCYMVRVFFDQGD